MGKPRLVFIASEPPLPITGGGNRTYHFLKAVAEVTRCSLFILFPVTKDKLPESILDITDSVRSAKTPFILGPKRKFIIVLYYLRLLFFPWSFKKKEIIVSTDYYVTNPYKGENLLKRVFFSILKCTLAEYSLVLYRFGYNFPVKTLERYDQFQEMKADIVDNITKVETLWIDFSSLLPFFLDIKIHNSGLKVICNAHNIEYVYQQRLAANTTNKISRRWYNCQARVMREAELNGFKLCDLIITCSEKDRQEIMQHIPGGNIKVLPNGVDLDYFTPEPTLSNCPSILFTGTMGYSANRDAVEYFVNCIFPLILKTIPDCKFIIAGANADQVFKKYVGKSEIEIVSSPDDIRPVYNKAWVVVVPIRSGSGTRLKILEALAMEKVVISTSVGAEGLELRDETDLLIADDIDAFVDKLIYSLNNLLKASKIGKNGKMKVSSYYSWSDIRKGASQIIFNV